MNLTCGRNPWKRASPEDSTYRAYLKDPKFLQQILPISPELNMILARIFDPEPWRRITIPELKAAVISCPRFTMRHVPAVRPITPPPEPYSSPFATFPELYIQAPQQPLTPPTYSIFEQQSASSNSSLSESGSTFSESSNCSSVSSQGSFGQAPEPQLVVFPSQPSVFYNTCTPILHGPGSSIAQHCSNQTPQVC